MPTIAIFTSALGLRNIRNEFHLSFSHIIHMSSQIISMRQTPNNKQYLLLEQSTINFNYQQDQVNRLLVNQLQPNPNSDKLQYAIYELYNFEINYLTTMNKLINVYQQPMLHFRLINIDESHILFANLHNLFQIHLNLVISFSTIQHNGNFECPAKLFSPFLKSIEQYEIYCTNLYESKKLLQKKMKNRNFVCFLQSEEVKRYSQKLDLFSDLDQPRRHLMQYSLLLKQIQSRSKHPDDIEQLEQVMTIIAHNLKQIDNKMEYAKFKQFVSQFHFPHEKKFKEQLDSNTSFHLKTDVIQVKRHKAKSKLFLFDKTMILAKQSLRRKKYIVQNAVQAKTEIYFYIGKCKSRSRYKPYTKLFTWCKRLKRQFKKYRSPGEQLQSNIMRLYSVQQSFDVTVKFRNHDEVNTWIDKLRESFKMIRKSNSYFDTVKDTMERKYSDPEVFCRNQSLTQCDNWSSNSLKV